MNKIAALGPHLEVKIELSEKEILEGSRSVLIYWREQGEEKWNPFTGCPYQEPYWSEFYQNWLEIGKMLAPGTWPAAQKQARGVNGGPKKKGQKSGSSGRSLPSGGGVDASKNDPSLVFTCRETGQFLAANGKTTKKRSGAVTFPSRKEAVAWAKGHGVSSARYRLCDVS